MKTNPPRHPRQRGSALIVALIFAAIIAISLTSYMRLTTNALKNSDRSFYSIAALNLAEIGLEEAVTALNR